MDGSSNLKWSDTIIVLESPDNLLIEHSLRFEFKANINQAKYEASIVGMNFTIEMGALSLIARCDSQVIVN